MDSKKKKPENVIKKKLFTSSARSVVGELKDLLECSTMLSLATRSQRLSVCNDSSRIHAEIGIKV